SKISDLPWQDLKLDLILESTGLYRRQSLLADHLNLAKRIILSAPPLDDLQTIVMGINEAEIKAEDRILSNASCTTNSAAPLIKVVEELCGIEHAFITTVHSYTTDQRLQDGPHKDFRRGRAAAESIVPTTTGAAKAITRIFPHLEGKIGGAGIRVPVPDGSLTDITFTVKRVPSVEALNNAFKEASESSLKPYLGYTSDPIVSRDVIGSSFSCWYDEELTTVLGPMVKVVGWYDNEMGYSHRLRDLMLYLKNRFQ
ncbi:MAG: type I glyceraldehyde-3-phosphate dehydrogenase, partial [Croceimicrobium sp.]